MRTSTVGLVVGILTAMGGSAQAAGKADLNGIWLPIDRNILTQANPQNRAAAGGGAPRAGGPGAPREGMPTYRPEWAARYQARLAEGRAGKVTIDPTAKCLPPGMPRTMSTPFPLEISVEPDRVLMLFEIGGVRRIPTDGSKHLSPDDLTPTFLGDSVGRWEGDALVVDTVGLRDDTVFDASGALHSDQMHIVERIRLLSPDKLEDRMTVDDPVAFAKPWEVTHVYDRKRDWRIMEFVCEENNRGIDPAAEPVK